MFKMAKKIILGSWLAMMILGTLSSQVHAAAPLPTRLIPYQGMIQNGGVPVNRKGMPILFSLYDSDTAGNMLWNDTLLVDVVDGRFSASLGSMKPLPDAVYSASYLYLEVTLDAGTSSAARMTTRQRITPVPFATSSAQGQNGMVVKGDLVVEGRVRGRSGEAIPATHLQTTGTTLEKVNMIPVSDGFCFLSLVYGDAPDVRIYGAFVGDKAVWQLQVASLIDRKTAAAEATCIRWN